MKRLARVAGKVLVGYVVTVAAADTALIAYRYIARGEKIVWTER